MKPPFSYFGGKTRVAPIIWSRLGKVQNYVEPFAGSLAVLLANPDIPKIETINDLDCFLCNFWRALSIDPDEVAKYADYPVIESDLHARHKWLVESTNDFKSKINSDPNYYDSKVAGWWVWGISASVGNNWLQSKGLNAAPLLSSAGGGIHGLTYNIQEQFTKLQERLKRVRVCCGDWKRVVTPSVTYTNVGLNNKDITGVFLDPPYESKGRDKVYKEDQNIYSEVCKWAIDNGDNSKLRIVVCGYDGDYNFPDNWETYQWQSNGGLANLGTSRGKSNSNRERIYFSPHCLKE